MNLESSIGRIETSIFLNFAALEELLHAFDDIFGTRHTVSIDRTLGSICRDVTELLRQISGTGRSKKLKISGMKYRGSSPPPAKNRRPQKNQYKDDDRSRQVATISKINRVIQRKDDAMVWRAFMSWRDMAARKREEEQQKELEDCQNHPDYQEHQRGEATTEETHNTRKQGLKSPEENDYWSRDDYVTSDERVVYERVSAGRESIPAMMTSPRKEHTTGAQTEERFSDNEDDDQETYLSNWLHHGQPGVGYSVRSASPLAADPVEYVHSDEGCRQDTRRPSRAVDIFGRVDDEDQNNCEDGGCDYGREEERGTMGGVYGERHLELPDDDDERFATGNCHPSDTDMIYQPHTSYTEPAEEIIYADDAEDHVEESYEESGRAVDASTDTSMDGIISKFTASYANEGQQPDESQETTKRRMSATDFMVSGPSIGTDNASGTEEGDCEQKDHSDILTAPNVVNTAPVVVGEKQGSQISDFVQNSQTKNVSRRNTYLPGAKSAPLTSDMSPHRFADDSSMSYGSARRAGYDVSASARAPVDRSKKIDLELFAYRHRAQSESSQTPEFITPLAMGTSASLELPVAAEEGSGGGRGVALPLINEAEAEAEYAYVPDALSAPPVATGAQLSTEQRKERQRSLPEYSANDIHQYLSLPLSGAHSELSRSLGSRGATVVAKQRRQSMSIVPNSRYLASGGFGGNSTDFTRITFDKHAPPSGNVTFLDDDNREQTRSFQLKTADDITRTIEKPPRPRRASVMVSRVTLDTPVPPPLGMSPVGSVGSAPSSGQSTPTRRRTPPPPPPSRS
jgi:hypothetical protein